jgi:uncharacterized protein YciI
MPHFALHCVDKPNSLELRLATRPQHVEYLKGCGDAVRLAGPYLDAAGDMCGSLVIIEAADLTAAQAFAAADPYAKAGLFERVEIRPFRAGLGKL